VKRSGITNLEHSSTGHAIDFHGHFSFDMNDTGIDFHLQLSFYIYCTGNAFNIACKKYRTGSTTDTK
jgi:hypothetical protein